MSVIRGTTPDFVLQLSGYSLTGKTVYVTFEQSGRKMTLTGDRLSIAVDASGSTIAFVLTQEDTLTLKEGAASVQVKAIDATGHVEATDIATLQIDRALLERVIKYADDTT